MNELLFAISNECSEKQILITTHSSFVANKLGLKNLILLSNNKTSRLNDLTEDTHDFFMKLSGYDTLRMLLCKKAILVEGDSDELVVQRAYLDKYGKLPIEDNIDVISARNLSFLRYLEIAKQLMIPVCVVTDNDGDTDALERKYAAYKHIRNTNTLKYAMTIQLMLNRQKSMENSITVTLLSLKSLRLILEIS